MKKYYFCNCCNEILLKNNCKCGSDDIENLEIIAVYGLTNNSSMNMYKIIHGINDSIIAGINNNIPELYTIEYEYNKNTCEYELCFYYGIVQYCLNEFLRV